METKKYYWLKLKEDFFEEDEISWIEEQENGKDYVLFYLKLCLKSIKTGGVLIRKVGDMYIPYDTKKLAQITNTPIDTVMAAMQILQAVKLVEILDNGEIYLRSMQQMIGSETSKAELMRKSRAKKKQEQIDNGNNVTTMLPDSSNNVDTEIEKEKEIDIEIDKKEKIKKEKNENDNPAESVKAKKTNFDEIISEYTENEDLKNALNDFIKMRKAIKAVITDRALKGICSKLDTLASTDEDKVKILDQSIMNSWKGVFPLKEGYNAETYSKIVRPDTSVGGRSDYHITDGLV
jgi:predicted phage replisome organizer